MQSDSTTGTTPDSRSLTDLYRTFDAAVTDRQRNGADPIRDHAYFDAADQFWQRMDKVADRYDTVDMVRDWAEGEPAVAWDAAHGEGRAR